MTDISMLLPAAFALLLFAPSLLEYLGMTRWSNAAPVVIGLGIVGLAALLFEAPTSEGGSAWRPAEQVALTRQPLLAEADWEPAAEVPATVVEPPPTAPSVAAATELTVATAERSKLTNPTAKSESDSNALPQSAAALPVPAAPSSPPPAPEPSRAVSITVPPAIPAGAVKTATLSPTAAPSAVAAAAVLASASAAPELMVRAIPAANGPANTEINPSLAELKKLLANGWTTKTFQIEAIKLRDVVEDQIGDYYRIALFNDVKGRPLRVAFKNGQYALNESNEIAAKKSLEALVDGLLGRLHSSNIGHQIYVVGYASNKQFALPRTLAPHDVELQRVQYIPDKGEGVKFGGRPAIQTISSAYQNADLPVLRGAYISRLIGKSGVKAKITGAATPVLAGDIRGPADLDSKSFDLILFVKW